MWQLSESHWRVHVYQLTDVWQVVSSCHCHNGITLPNMSDLWEAKLRERKLKHACDSFFIRSDAERRTDCMSSDRNFIFSI